MVVHRLWVPTSISGLSRWDEDGQFGPGTSGYLPPFPVCACLSLCTREHGKLQPFFIRFTKFEVFCLSRSWFQGCDIVLGRRSSYDSNTSKRSLLSAFYYSLSSTSLCSSISFESDPLSSVLN